MRASYTHVYMHTHESKCMRQHDPFDSTSRRIEFNETWSLFVLRKNPEYLFKVHYKLLLLQSIL